MIFFYSVGQPTLGGMEFWVKQQSERKISPHTARVKFTFRGTGHRWCNRSMERLSLAKVRVCVQLNCLISLGSRARERARKDKECKHAKSRELTSPAEETLSSMTFYPSPCLKKITQREASMSTVSKRTLSVGAKNMWETRGLQVNYQHRLTSGSVYLKVESNSLWSPQLHPDTAMTLRLKVRQCLLVISSQRDGGSY